MRQFLKSISIALQNIRANPLHTFLSTLGIIIGVAAMVGILALGDGLEQAGREQMANTTSLNIVSINSKSTKIIDEIRVQIQNRPHFNINQVLDLSAKFTDRALVEYSDTRSAEIVREDSVYGAYLQGSMDKGILLLGDSLEFGRYITIDDVKSFNQVAVLTASIANKLVNDPIKLIDTFLEIEGKAYQVIGIFPEGTKQEPKVIIPISIYDANKDQYPTIVLKAFKAEDIPLIKEEIEIWLDNNFDQGKEAFAVSTNKARVEQFSQGILMFKLIMGAITGISVLVGGIGVMNVLLISVTERTKEIGIRKATGAKKKDIILQFMAESVTISFVGCVFGWVLGIAGVFTFVPIVNALTDFGEFRAAIGVSTVLSILVIALFVGVIFGTYPAWRAAQLTPVDAIRHE